MPRHDRTLVQSISRIRVSTFILLSFFYLAILFVGPSIILPSQANDAQTIQSMAISANEFDKFDGYASMALIYSSTSYQVRFLFIISMSLYFIYLTIRQCSSIESIVVGAFLVFAPILLFLCFFVKDTMYIPFMIVCVYILNRVVSNLGASLAVFLLLLVYAYFFRQYFILIALVFLLLICFNRFNWTSRAIFAIFSIIVLVMLPNDIFTTLQESRDIVNRHRIGFSGDGNRTVFLNLLPPTDLWSFLINYVYATLRLTMPVFFGAFGAKEVFLMANSAIFAWLLWVGLRSRDRRVWRPAVLFLSHFSVLMLFEPDLGSYLRHISTSVPLLGPALGQVGAVRWIKPRRADQPRRRGPSVSRA
jgi:hypothetical protein